MGKLKAFADDPKVNFVGAVISVVAEIVNWLSTFSGNGPIYALGPAAFGLTVFFFGRLAWVHYRDAEAFREQAKPKFDITFLPENDDDSRPYLQTLMYGQLRGGGMPMKEMRDRRYRIAIKNMSTAIIPAVHVVLARCEPGDNFIHIGHRMLVTDSDPPESERDLHPNANGEPTLFFDVVNENGGASKTPREFRFCFANPNICGPVQPFDTNTWEITLRAEGGGYSTERSFRIEKKYTDQWMHAVKMVPL